MPAQIQQLKANATVFVVQLGAAGGWTDLSRQTTLGVNQEEATYRAEADDIISRCLGYRHRQLMPLHGLRTQWLYRCRRQSIKSCSINPG